MAFTAVIPDYSALGLVAMWPALVDSPSLAFPGAQDGIEDILYWHRVT